MQKLDDGKEIVSKKNMNFVKHKFNSKTNLTLRKYSDFFSIELSWKFDDLFVFLELL